MKRFLVFDTETSGLTDIDLPYQLGLAVYDDENHKLAEINCHPRSDDLVQNSIEIAKVFFDVLSDFNVTHLVGYNVDFDIAMIIRSTTEEVRTCIDFSDLLIVDVKEYYKSGSLSDNCRKEGIEIEEDRLHEALYDVELTAKLFFLNWQKDEYNYCST